MIRKSVTYNPFKINENKFNDLASCKKHSNKFDPKAANLDRHVDLQYTAIVEKSIE